MLMNKLAPMGTIYVCSACGRRSRDICGTVDASSGWDESCRTHAVLCDESSLAIHSGAVCGATSSSKQPLEMPWVETQTKGHKG
jgi:hypothetical protein